MELFCKHYQNLVQGLQPSKVCEYMFFKGLLNKRDYTMITNAPCDRIRNSMIIEHVRHQSSSYLFTFLDVLQKTDQRYLYDTLISALQYDGFLKLPDDYDIVALDDDEYEDDDDRVYYSSFHPQYIEIKYRLKMNLSINSIPQPIPDQKESTLPDINIQYLCLIDDLCKLMESCDPGVFIDKCATLMASYIHNIPLFSDETLKDFREYHNTPALLRYLMCYFAWCDLSTIIKLLEICDYPDGIRLLQTFKHKIEGFTIPMMDYPIFYPCSLMMPSESSPYIVMITDYEFKYSSVSLKHIEMIKSLITEKCKITFISCQFLGVADDSQSFHWLIPKSIAPFLMINIERNQTYLNKNGIKKISIHLHWAPSLFGAVSTDTNIEKACQQKLDEMKLKCNILCEEIDSLKSQLDTVHKQSKSKLIEEYRRLKDKEKCDTATQTDLRYQHDAFKSRVDAVDAQSSTKLFEKHRQVEKRDAADLPVKFSFSTPKQHSSETTAAPVAPGVSSISLPTCPVPPKISFPSQLNVLPSTQPLSLSGSSAAVKSSERKPLPLKTGNCLEILMPSKPSLPSNSLLSQKFKPAEGSWECPACMVNNKATDDKCAACTTSRPGSAPAATAGAVSTSSVPQQSLLSQKFKPAEGSWEWPSCMVNNKAIDDKCATCTTSRPGSAPAGLSSAPSGSSGQSTGLTMGSSGGLQLGSSRDFKLGSSGGLQLGSSGGFKLGITKSESATVSEPTSGGLKLESSGGLQLGSGGGLKLESSGGFKLGLSDDLKLGSGGNLKLGSTRDTKLGTSSNLTFSSGGGLQLGSNSALQMGSTNSNNPQPPSNIIITTTITSGFRSSSSTTQSLSTRFKPAEGSWECPACMVNNKATDDKCAACTTSRLGSTPAATVGTSSTEGNTLLSMPGPEIKFGATGGLQLGSLSQNVSSNSSSKPVLLGKQPSLAPLTTKPLETGSSSSGGLQLGSGGGLQLGTGGLQLGSSSGGIKLGLPTSVQPASGEAIKLTGSAEGASVTNNLGGVLLGKKKSLSHTEDETDSASIVEPVIGNNSLVGNPLGLVPLNKPAVTTAKSVTFKLDSDNKTDNSSNNTQISFGIPQPSSSGALTASGFTLVSSLTASGDGKLSVTSDSSTVKPFANLFPPKSTSSTLNFSFPKPTSAASTLTTTSSSTLLNPSLSFNIGLSSSTATTSTKLPRLFNFTQQSLFTTPGQVQQGTSSGLDLKLPTCQEKKENSGNVTFNFSEAKNNQLLASQGQQGMSTGLGLTQATTQQGFNFHADMQNQAAPFFSTNLGSSGLITTSTSSSVLFTDQLNTIQADNASGIEISDPAAGEPQHLPSLTAPVEQGLQLQFGDSNNPPSQPFVFNNQQQNQNMFEGNSSNIFGANNPVLGGNLPASMISSVTPSITNQPIKRARRRIPNRP